METKANHKLVPVPVQRLEVGMFVAELDRPWDETPFRFQGFEILSQAEIDLLRQHCRTVMIDSSFVSSSTTRRPVRDGSNVIGLEGAREAGREELCRALTGQVPQDYPASDGRRRDAPAARAAIVHARAQRAALLDALRRDRRVRAAHCRGVVEPLAQRALVDPDAVIWAAMVDKSTDLAGDRAVATAAWCAVFGRYLGVPAPTLIDMTSGALLLDLGMTRLVETLRDDTASYGKTQTLAMRAHVTLGLDMLDRITDTTDTVRVMLSQHHERHDGTGYPTGQDESGLSPFGLIAGVVDRFDAMVTGNVRTPAVAPSVALGELIQEAESGARASLVAEQFLQAIGRFPSGSIVELNSGAIGVVTAGDPDRRLRPTVEVLTDADKTPKPASMEQRLRALPSDTSNPNAVWIVRGHAPGAFGIDPATLDIQ